METKIFFQLTTSRGDRPYAYCVAVLSDFFNSRPLVEVDIQWCMRFGTVRFFNSRPLVEVDPLSGAIYSTIYFSTHDLSWRSTCPAL